MGRDQTSIGLSMVLVGGWSVHRYRRWVALWRIGPQRYAAGAEFVDARGFFLLFLLLVVIQPLWRLLFRHIRKRLGCETRTVSCGNF